MSPDPYISPCLRIHVSASSNLRILCKIHVSDSRLSIHVSASIYISGSSARSMSPDPCLSIFISQELLQDPCLRFMSYSILIIRFCGPAQAKRKFWPPETRFVWPCAGKTVRPSVSRRRFANFELPRCIFCARAQAKRKFDHPRRVLCPYHVDSRGVTTRWTKIATALQRDAKKNSQQPFRAGETQILTSGIAFFVALRSENRGDRKFAPRPKRLYPYRKNPSVCHTVWGNTQNNQRIVLG